MRSDGCIKREPPRASATPLTWSRTLNIPLCPLSRISLASHPSQHPSLRPLTSPSPHVPLRPLVSSPSLSPPRSVSSPSLSHFRSVSSPLDFTQEAHTAAINFTPKPPSLCPSPHIHLLAHYLGATQSVWENTSIPDGVGESKDRCRSK